MLYENGLTDANDMRVVASSQIREEIQEASNDFENFKMQVMLEIAENTENYKLFLPLKSLLNLRLSSALEKTLNHVSNYECIKYGLIFTLFKI